VDRRTLTYRVLTAVVGIPLLLGAAWLGGWWWASVVAVLAVVAAIEYVRLYPEVGTFFRWVLLVGVCVILLLRWWVRILDGDQLFAALVATWSVLMYAGAILPVVFSADPSRTFNSRRPSDASGWGILYIGLSAAALVQWGFDVGFRVILWFFAVIWANDIGAYFGGYALGRHKVAPRLSPGKTWEGAVVGLIAGTVVAWALASILGLTGGQAIVIGLLITLAAQLGDLFESAMKRRAGVKDSGVIFPGHGGVLDRFDGVFAAAPVAYLLLHWWAS
jgi:phosphatidate cytidylyltransferase